MGDQQLATRISDPMLRAWLLMNLRQVIKTTKKNNDFGHILCHEYMWVGRQKGKSCV